MSAIETKIRIKFGQLEIEYEGRESFLENDISNFLDKVVSLHKESNGNNVFHSPTEEKKTNNSAEKEQIIDYSVTTFASRLEATTGSDLALAAAASLTFAKGKKTFSRAEIRSEMREASNYFNNNMISNLSASLKRLVSSRRLNETSSGTYALTANEKAQMEKLLA